MCAGCFRVLWPSVEGMRLVVDALRRAPQGSALTPFEDAGELCSVPGEGFVVVEDDEADGTVAAGTGATA